MKIKPASTNLVAPSLQVCARECSNENFLKTRGKCPRARSDGYGGKKPVPLSQQPVMS
jgi:hypothetical protein